MIKKLRVILWWHFVKYPKCMWRDFKYMIGYAYSAISKDKRYWGLVWEKVKDMTDYTYWIWFDRYAGEIRWRKREIIEEGLSLDARFKKENLIQETHGYYTLAFHRPERRYYMRWECPGEAPLEMRTHNQGLTWSRFQMLSKEVIRRHKKKYPSLKESVPDTLNVVFDEE